MWQIKKWHKARNGKKLPKLLICWQDMSKLRIGNSRNVEAKNWKFKKCQITELEKKDSIVARKTSTKASERRDRF